MYPQYCLGHMNTSTTNITHCFSLIHASFYLLIGQPCLCVCWGGGCQSAEKSRPSNAPKLLLLASVLQIINTQNQHYS